MKTIFFVLTMIFASYAFAQNERSFYIDEDAPLNRRITKLMTNKGYYPVTVKAEADMVIYVRHSISFIGRVTSVTIWSRDRERLFHAYAYDSKNLLERTSKQDVLRELSENFPELN